MSTFSTQTYIERRKKLKELVGSGIIMLLGNEESSINFKDNWYHFRQDSSFLYFFGISLPGLVGIINCDTGEETIFGDELTMDHIVWTGPQPTVAQLAEKVGVDQTHPTSKLSDEISNNGHVHILPPYRDTNLINLNKWWGKSIAEIKQLGSKKLIEAIVAIRSYKSDEELVELEKAVNITAGMHYAAMKIAKPGMSECEIVGKINQTAIASGGQLSFQPIVTTNGQILHNHYYGNTLKDGDMVLCDTGAETTMGYAGDMTRTFPVGNQFTARQRELYQVVLDAHEAAIAALRPGVKYMDVHLLACKTLVKGLNEVGLMKGDVDEAVATGSHTMFFQCGLGHMMGLDVHDMEDLGEEFVGYNKKNVKSTEFGLKSLRLGRELEERFVLTVEPGIYIIPELIDMWKSDRKNEQFINYDLLESYKDFGGIRIEEDFVITSDGSRLLGNPVAKTVADVEAVRSESLAMANG